MNQSSDDITLIWLDDHIGMPENNAHLKNVFASNIDPSNSFPIGLLNEDWNAKSHLTSPVFVTFGFGIASQLLAFTNPDRCLACIRESLEANKQIYVIVSDSIGNIFVPCLFMEHPEAFHKGCIQIYILTFSAYLDMDSLLDYPEHEYVLVFHHEADLLCRLLLDIASYYIEIGKTSLNQGMLADIHQALTYFQWARTLLLRACKTDTYRCLKTARSAQNLIDQAEKRINDEIISSEDDKYVRDDWKKSLNNSIFIYHSQEYRQEATQLSSILNTLTNEQGVLFEDYMMFIAKFQKEKCSIKHGCPIIIASNNINQTKIFTELSSLVNIDQIYVLRPRTYTSSTRNDQTLLEQFSKVRNIYSQAKILALEWTVERSSICDKIGDLCSENDDHDLARAYYTKAIQLNQNLSDFIKKK